MAAVMGIQARQSTGRFRVASDGRSEGSSPSGELHPQTSSPPEYGSGRLLKGVATILYRGPRRTSLLKHFVTSPVFDVLVGAVIFANAAFIAVETDWNARHLDDPLHESAFVYLAFNSFFAVELGLRILAFRCSFFFSKERYWNWLDTALVVSFVVEQCLVVQHEVAQAGKSLRAIRLLRLSRTVRIVRTLKTVREFHKMVWALLWSVRTLVCALLILFLSIFFFGIIFCQGTSDYLNDWDPELEVVEGLEPQFGTLLLSFLTLFKSVSGGLEWTAAWEVLDAVHPAYGCLFVVYIAVVVFGVLNVVTSVFVESALAAANREKELIMQETEDKKRIALKHMQALFRQMDADHSGGITADEMEEFLTDDSLRGYLEALNIRATDTRMLFRLLDRDNSKKVDIEEFCDGCLRLQGEARSLDIHTLLYMMRQFFEKWSDFTVFMEESLVQSEGSSGKLPPDAPPPPTMSPTLSPRTPRGRKSLSDLWISTWDQGSVPLTETVRPRWQSSSELLKDQPGGGGAARPSRCL